MISIVGRKLIIPENERVIGSEQDNKIERRVFCLPRRATNDRDMGSLTYRLDIEFEDGSTDVCYLDKSIADNHVHLTWDIVASNLKAGNVFIWIRGMGDNGDVRFYTEKEYVQCFPTSTATASATVPVLSELQKMESMVDEVINDYNARVMSGALTGPQGPQGPEGPQGPQGPQGEPGINAIVYTVVGSGMFALEGDDEGNLYAIIPDESIGPTFSTDEEGNIYMEVE